MDKKSGFSLLELVLSLGLLSIVLVVFFKLRTLEYRQKVRITEEQNLMAYADVLEWTLRNVKGPKVGVWSGFQDLKTKERKFVRGFQKNCICCANISINGDFYRTDLRGKNLQNENIKPITRFIAK